jgi:hypothetical protein
MHCTIVYSYVICSEVRRFCFRTKSWLYLGLDSQLQYHLEIPLSLSGALPRYPGREPLVVISLEQRLQFVDAVEMLRSTTVTLHRLTDYTGTYRKALLLRLV